MVQGASVVNISSLAGLIGIVDHTVYSATKAALDALTKCWAIEFGPRNIRVNSLNPTAVLTEMGRRTWSDPARSQPFLNNIPLRRFVEMDEAVDPIIYLLSDKSSFINGHLLPIEGGYLAC